MEERIIETTEGLQDEHIVREYDKMQRDVRDSGWLDKKIKLMIEKGLCSGTALEIGPGPGYFGLEWLKATENTSLCGLDISKAMADLARENSREYGFGSRTDYRVGDAGKMEFADNAFDLAISSYSLHEWEFPLQVLQEIGRVLKENGSLFILDWRRDMKPHELSFIMHSQKDKYMREGFLNSVNASYTRAEIKEMFEQVPNVELTEVEEKFFGIYMIASKRIVPEEV
ncbi:class I SAM-dependent methyltransferase [Paenibacillus thailandensis]|uniref:Class I SAM-dependent methyltransferase n=1 Tax=Paenibacillus thailandensis TaxID=393250 RepID=A0ABW5R3T5_9BACL